MKSPSFHLPLVLQAVRSEISRISEVKEAIYVPKDEALQILKSAEEAGLIHKAFHNGSNINKEENSICNCCKDCCDTFELWRSGTTPLVNSTNYLSIVKEGDKLKFYINDNWVHSTDFQPFFGKEFGFRVNHKMSISIDYLKISYLD